MKCDSLKKTVYEYDEDFVCLDNIALILNGRMSIYFTLICKTSKTNKFVKVIFQDSFSLSLS